MSDRRRGPARATAELLRPAWMSRDVTIVVAARAAMSAARALSAIVVPIYLALIGFSAVRLGLLFLAVAAASTLLTAGVGLLADRVGRKPFLVGLPLLAVGAALTFSFRVPQTALFVAAALGSFGRGSGAGAGAIGPYAPAESALASDHTPARFRNAVFGRLGFASALGALIGSLLAGLAGRTHRPGAAALAGFRPAFLAVAALALVAGVVALWIEDARPPRRRERRRPAFPRRSAGLLARLWATNTVNGLAVGMFGPFVTYWFFRRYGVGAGTIGLLYAVINLATMASVLSAAEIARRAGLVRTIVGGRTLQALLLVPMALAPSFVLAGAIYLVRMLAQRLSLPLRQSYTMAMAHPEERAAVAGLSNLPSQAASAASPTLAGYLFDHVSLALPFELAGALQLANAWLFFAFFRHLRPEEERLATAEPSVEPAAGPPSP